MTSLLTAVDCRGHVHLVVGAESPLAAVRCSQSLAAGAQPVLVAPEPAAAATTGGTGGLPAALQARVDAGEVRWVRTALDVETHLSTLGRPEVDGVPDAVFVVPGKQGGSGSGDQEEEDKAVAAISAACRRRRIPINVVDRPDLCSFALLSTHVDGPLQIGVTTNGCGCKLAARVRREVAAALPPGLGAACARLGALRRRIQAEDRLAEDQRPADDTTPTTATATTTNNDGARTLLPPGDLDDSYDQPAAFNQLVRADDDADAAAAAAAAKTRRMRWLAQMCEYWPLKRLASVTDADVDALLQAHAAGQAPAVPDRALPAAHADSADSAHCPPTTHSSPTTGRIILAGAGPGRPDLLTRAVHEAILAADVVLADKLVPQGVLDLVPRRATVAIARKFPGNAEAAQDELIAQATAAARAGQTVVRLKQGDPFLYGRGGEEVLRLRAAGFEDGRSLFVLPGITSALAAPLFAAIPPTHRDAADQVLICTGTGKRGQPPPPPGYRPARTAVFLMALHRIGALVAELTGYLDGEDGKDGEDGEDGKALEDTDRRCHRRILWPPATPCAVIERASCPDQRVLRTTLQHVAAAVEQEGSRPPGLLVVGRACDVLRDGASQAADPAKPWTVEEGCAGLDLGLGGLAGL